MKLRAAETLGCHDHNIQASVLPGSSSIAEFLEAFPVDSNVALPITVLIAPRLQLAVKVSFCGGYNVQEDDINK